MFGVKDPWRLCGLAGLLTPDRVRGDEIRGDVARDARPGYIGRLDMDPGPKAYRGDEVPGNEVRGDEVRGDG